MTLRQELSIAPEMFEGMLQQAVTHYTEGRLDESEVLLRGLSTLDPNDARPWKLLGAVMLLKHRDSDAVDAYRRALQLDPEDPYSLVGLAELRLNALQFGEAVALLSKLFAMDPDGKHPAANRGRELVDRAHARMNAR